MYLVLTPLWYWPQLLKTYCPPTSRTGRLQLASDLGRKDHLDQSAVACRNFRTRKLRDLWISWRTCSWGLTWSNQSCRILRQMCKFKLWARDPKYREMVERAWEKEESCGERQRQAVRHVLRPVWSSLGAWCSVGFQFQFLEDPSELELSSWILLKRPYAIKYSHRC